MGRVFRFAQPLFFCAATLLMVAGTCVPNMRAQDALPTPTRPAPRLGGPQDWSNQHVIYTLNGSVDDMLKLRDDPRVLHSIVLHYMREHRNQTGETATAGWNEAAVACGPYPHTWSIGRGHRAYRIREVHVVPCAVGHLAIRARRNTGAEEHVLRATAALYSAWDVAVCDHISAWTRDI